MINSKSGFQLF